MKKYDVLRPITVHSTGQKYGIGEQVTEADLTPGEALILVRQNKLREVVKEKKANKAGGSEPTSPSSSEPDQPSS